MKLILLGQLVVGVYEGRDVLVVHIVLNVVDVQQTLERHVVVHVAAFVEVVQASDVVELVVEGLTEQLELLRDLPLMLVVGDALEGISGYAVQRGADLPGDRAVRGDRLECQLVGPRS